MACLVHYVPNQTLVTFSVLREKPDFTPIEMKQMRSLRPYVVGLYEGWVLQRWDRRFAMEAVSSLRGAVVVAGSGCGIVFVSERARRLIQKYFGESASERLPARLSECCETASEN